MEHFRTAQEIVLRSIWSDESPHLQVVQLINKSHWFDIYFFFIRFLLICQVEGLDLTFTLNSFLRCLRTLSQNSSKNSVWSVFKPKQKKDFYRIFSLIFGLTFSLKYLRQKSSASRLVQVAIFGFENILESFSPIFKVNYSTRKPAPIFRIWLKKWRFLWAWLLEICGTQLFLRHKLSCGLMCLAAQALTNPHCLFHSTFLFNQLSILSFNHGFSKHFKCFMSYIFIKKNLPK